MKLLDALKVGVESRGVENADDDLIISQLITQGISEALASDIVCFVPSAFAHVHFEALGLKVPASYLMRLGNTRTNNPPRLYKNNRLYREARKLAHQWYQRPEKQQTIKNLIARTSEMRAIGQAKNNHSPIVSASTIYCTDDITYESNIFIRLLKSCCGYWAV